MNSVSDMLFTLRNLYGDLLLVSVAALLALTGSAAGVALAQL